MSKPRLVLCNGARFEEKGRHEVQLRTFGPEANVNVKVENIAKVFTKSLRPRILDLLELAAFVFAADTSSVRDGAWREGGSIEPWSRDFKFVVSVRDLDFWNQQEINEELVRLLGFISEDKFEFVFQPLGTPPSKPEYFEFGDYDEWPLSGVDRVVMFSGGLDSLAGAIRTASEGKPLVLVSHRPVATLATRQKELAENLSKLIRTQLLHVPVWVNKDGKLNREPTQRSRSFLFTSLGAAVADSLKAQGVRFFENGVVSLNLAVADEVLRSRASRTTHPFGLKMLSSFMSKVLERELVIDNPFVTMTKADVVREICNKGGEGLIEKSCSCAHSIFKSKTKWHCGTCSQCIDRRLAILTEGRQSADPASDYEVDVISGHRREGYEQNMAVNFVRHAHELNLMSEGMFMGKFNTEISRAIRGEPNGVGMAQQYFEMHRRHAASVMNALKKEAADASGDLLNGKLPKSSLLALAVGQEHLRTLWQQYAAGIVAILKRSLPVACRDRSPTNEKDLQALCDGLLKAADEKLTREYPLMRWASALTKPDWSTEGASGLWIELKYVREKKQVSPILEAIAADITKYGDSGAHVLFVIYDPKHIVDDESTFAEPVRHRERMFVEFVR